jgi:cytosine/adenosine deaminase-related metal-dependent hydrolase
MHNHILKDPIHYEEEFENALQAYRDIGMRVNFCPAIRNQNHFVYGDNQSFLNSLPKEIKEILLRSSDPHAFSDEKYFDVIDHLSRHFRSDLLRVSFGPLAPQWCTDDLLTRIKRVAGEEGLEIHMHVLQTVLQKLYGVKTYGKSLIGHLRDIGLLGKNLSIGHCVYATSPDIDLLAESGTSVSHHPSCNLRERNGIAPVHWMVQRGVRVGIGLDGKGINDDDDFIQEMRMGYLFHRLASHELDSPYLSSRDLFRMATVNGAEMLGFGDQIGRLEKGRRADIVLINLDRILQPYVDPRQDLFDVFLYRAKGSDVNTVIINGEVVMKDREILKIEKRELSQRIKEEGSRERTVEEKAFQEAVRKLRGYLSEYYKDWYQEIALEPYYIFNSKI